MDGEKYELVLRPAEMTDCQTLLDWRNDLETRRNSLTMEVVGLAEHREWLSRALVEPSRQLLIATLSGWDVGTVRIDGFERERELSWTVSPDFRGRGLGRKMVCEVVRQLGPPLRARVRVGNEASKRICRAAGFRYHSTIDGVELWRLTA